ncbi:MAG: hypothetical protein J07HX5_01373 [halophilic archaeon J07HX5]|nr:MAG: hypothetical protein J07HX5_01373 [halophilic archaeon J07HX5]
MNAASDLSVDTIERRDGSPPRDRLAAGQAETDADHTADDDANAQDAPEDLTPASANQEPVAVRERKAEISGLETLTRQMLSVYYTDGPMKPTEVHAAAGGDGDRKRSYARNRALRTRGLINHVGQGYYDDRLRAVLREDDGLAEHNRIDQHLQEIERVALGED